MEKEDKDIMNYLNDFVLYCRGFYKKTDNIISDVFNLLKTEFMFVTEADVPHNMLNMWSKWNETLPADVKLTVFNFLKNINDYKELTKGINISIDDICTVLQETFIEYNISHDKARQIAETLKYRLGI